MEIEDIASIIREWRERECLSLTEAGKLIGISGTSVNFYETGKGLPREKTLSLLAAVIPELNLDELIPKLRKQREKETAARLGKMRKTFANKRSQNKRDMEKAAQDLREHKEVSTDFPVPGRRQGRPKRNSAPSDTIRTHSTEEGQPKADAPQQTQEPSFKHEPRTYDLTPGQQMAAISWAAQEHGMGYGTFVAREMCGLSKEEIYRRYREFLVKRQEQRYQQF